MKRSLLLMRHAKSSWDDPSLADSQRPLNGRGTRDAPEMGRRLLKSGYRCDLLISSPAVRAFETAQGVASELGFSGEIVRDARLYMASEEDFLAVIREVDEGVKHLMLVSHNPGIEAFFSRISGEHVEKFPTAACALIAFEGTWASFETGTLEAFDYPKRRR